MGTRAVGRGVAALAAVAVAVSGCGSGGGSGAPATPDAVGVLRADVPRDVRSAPTVGLVNGLNAFGQALMQAVHASSGNVVVSPLSIAIAFSMARAGARGATAAEIDRVLHFPGTGRDAAFNTLMRALVTTDGPPPRARQSTTRSPGAAPLPPVLAIANGLFGARGLKVGGEFLRTLAAEYGAGLRTLDFASPNALAAINGWVREQTADRIQRLFDSLDPATKLVLANAVYLKAEWQVPFAEEPTSDAEFTLADGTRTRVPTMRASDSFGYAAGPGWRAVELRYAAGPLAMWVLVPAGRSDPAALLAPATLRAVATGMHETRLALSLPKWDFATSLDLTTVLEGMGLRVPFTPAADFSGIMPGLFINQAVHRANITVDEWGTEAAAVTGLGFVSSAAVPPPVEVNADHPFAFAIVDRTTRAPLFVGTVGDPRRH